MSTDQTLNALRAVQTAEEALRDALISTRSVTGLENPQVEGRLNDALYETIRAAGYLKGFLGGRGVDRELPGTPSAPTPPAPAQKSAPAISQPDRSRSSRKVAAKPSTTPHQS